MQLSHRFLFQTCYPISVWRHLPNLERRKEICGSSHLLLDLVFIFRCSMLGAGLGADDEQHLRSMAFLLTNHWDQALGSKDFSKT